MKRLAHIHKDYYGGALMLLTGLLAAYASIDYRVGSLSHMGPGFFPMAIGVLLAITGALIALSARKPAPKSDGPALHGHGHGLPDLRGSICIILGTLAFMLFGHYGGLVPATFAIVFICGLGDRGNTPMQALMLALIMSIVAVLVFSVALQIQLPLFRWGA